MWYVNSCGYADSSFYVWNKQKTTQRGSLCVTNSIVLNQTFVYHERVYADSVVKFVNKVWLVRFFSAHRNSKYFANITSDKVSQSVLKVKDQILLCKLDLNFLRPSRYFNFARAFAVDMSLLKKRAQGFNEICNGRPKTGFQIVKVWRIWKLFSSKTTKFRSVTFYYNDG